MARRVGASSLLYGWMGRQSGQEQPALPPGLVVGLWAPGRSCLVSQPGKGRVPLVDSLAEFFWNRMFWFGPEC